MGVETKSGRELDPPRTTGRCGRVIRRNEGPQVRRGPSLLQGRSRS